MRILSTNYIKDATITALTETPGYVFDTALKDTRLSRKGRTLSKDDQTFIFDLGSAKAVDYFLILDHNLTSSATVKLQGNATNVWTAPTIDITITIADYLYHGFTSAETYRYWRVTIDDPTNLNDYIQFSKVYLGAYLQMPYMSRDQQIPTDTTSDVSKSNSLQAYGNAGILFKKATINYKNIDNTDRILIDNALRLLDIYTPFIMLVWESDLTLEPPLYAILTTPPNWQRSDQIGLKWNLSLSFEQTF
jgi:hypothetical protein